MVTLSSRLVSTNFGTCWYQCLLSYFTPISLHILKYKVNLNYIKIFISYRALNTLRLLNKIQSVNAVQYMEIIAVFPEVPTKHMNAVCRQQVECLMLKWWYYHITLLSFRTSSRIILKLEDVEVLVW
jgi:hypothetical protein